jgi:UDP-N-acetylglucosamine 2-epimerase
VRRLVNKDSAMKVVTILGARPQFIKAAPVIKALRRAGHEECLIHTGQHYDYGMSRVFFEELGIPKPEVNLGVGSGPHGWQTGKMLLRIEEVLVRKKPDLVIVYGDTNSTLAGALAAVKLHIPLAHVEAGLRSFNKEMPEEHNRVLTDRCSAFLFCPTKTAVDNLTSEGIKQGVYQVGDTMYDALLQFIERAAERSTILNDLGLNPKKYLLATVHRPYNTDAPDRLHNIMMALFDIGEPIVFPVHPRTRKKIAKLSGLFKPSPSANSVRMIEPVGYLDMLMLEKNARLILTDSGGMQKEAYFFRVPCVTMRPETEWVETVKTGWNVLTNCDRYLIVRHVLNMKPPKEARTDFGDGNAAGRILKILQSALPTGRPL